MEFFEQLWTDLHPISRLIMQDGVIGFLTILAGKMAGAGIKARFSATEYDRYPRYPDFIVLRSQEKDDVGIRDRLQKTMPPSKLLGYLVTGTLWALGLYLISELHGKSVFGDRLWELISRVWIFAGAGAFLLIAGAWIMRRIQYFLHNFSRTGDSTDDHQSLVAEISRVVSLVAVVVIPVMLVLLAAIASAELVGLDITMKVLLSLWELFRQIIVAGCIVGMGWIGLSLLRYKTPEFSNHLADHTTGLFIVTASLFLAAAMLINTLIGLIALPVAFVIALILFRKRFLNPAAGVILKAYGVKFIVEEDIVYKVKAIGLVNCRLEDAVTRTRIENWELLRSILDGERRMTSETEPGTPPELPRKPSAKPSRRSQKESK